MDTTKNLVTEPKATPKLDDNSPAHGIEVPELDPPLKIFTNSEQSAQIQHITFNLRNNFDIKVSEGRVLLITYISTDEVLTLTTRTNESDLNTIAQRIKIPVGQHQLKPGRGIAITSNLVARAQYVESDNQGGNSNPYAFVQGVSIPARMFTTDQVD